MAFLEATVVDSKQRFSLLLLEPGEIFFQDFSVNCYPHGIPESEALKRCQKGRLHICSKSLVFDPKDFSQPILKFSYCDIVSADSWTGSLLTKLGSNDKNFVISTNQTIEMKVHNEIAPYVFKREKKQFLFSLIHSKVEDCLPYISQLLRASTLPRHDQAAMISVIVHSRHSRQKFDSSRLEDVYESIAGQFRVDRVTPLVINPGLIMLTTSRLYFQPFNNISPAKIQLCDIKQVIRRRFILRHTAIEIHCKESRKSNCQQLYLSLQNESECSELYQLILNQNAVQLDDPGQENMTLRWQNGIVTNFEYLSYLNDLADRSINDLTQYPVFPWVIADYTSPVLDLQNPATFRDLSKPMGALNPERLVKLLDRFSDMQEPRFLYGSHYSTPAYILFYLIRAAPEYALCLHSGRFDAPDRMFNGISDVFKNCLTNLSDFKELIPEFYNSNGNFLQNLQQINFGITQTNRAVTDVLLPPWADSPQDMIEKFRQALESEYVSNNLHHWIDLIFGYKQRGEEAIAANNLFYHLTYEGSVDLDSIENLEDRSALETQIMEFGQTPKQLFTRPHPCRLVNSNVSPSVPLSVDDINETTDVNDGISQSKSVFHSDNFSCYAEHSLHKDFVTDVKWSQDGQTLFSCSKDSSLKIYSVPVQRQLRSFNICNMPLSSFALMPDEKTVIAGSWDNNIYIYNIDCGRLVNQVIAHDDAVSQLSYSNNLLLSGSWDSMITLWGCRYKNQDLNQLELMVQFEHDAGVNCVCQNNDNTRLVSGTKDGYVTFFSPDRPYPISCHKAHSGSVHSLSFSSDCKQLITCGQDGCLKVFDMTTETEVFSKNAGSELRCAVWSDRSVITGTSSGQLLIWDLVRGDILDSLPGHNADVLCLDLTSDKQICSGGMDKKVKMWKQ